MDQLITESVINNKKEEVAVSTFTGKDRKVGIYFSAHWCPPCRQFTPTLVDFYNKEKAEGKNFEIVFVSSDRDEAGFMDYFGTMPWLAVRFGSDLVKQLKSKFKVQGIPTFVIVDGETGTTIDANARGGVMAGSLKI